jgi:4-hydroxy-3-polyprenylbenzoate decarboxylase
MKKAYPGHAKRVMLGGMVVSAPVHVHKMGHRRGRRHQRARLERRDVGSLHPMDPARDITVIENTPIDYLDFASPQSGLGSKIGWTRPTSCRPKPTANGARRSRWTRM